MPILAPRFRLVTQFRRQIAVLGLAAIVLTSCGAAGESPAAQVTGDATATFVVSLTQVAEARAFVATSTAAARVTRPTATAAATAGPPTATLDPFAEVTPAPHYEEELLTLLPPLEVFPSGFVVLSEGPLTAETVASVYSDDIGYVQQLTTWGFRQGAIRVVGLPEPSQAKPNGMVAFLAAVLEFGSSEQARAAMLENREYIRKGMIGAPDNITLEGLADSAIAVRGDIARTGAIERWACIWVQRAHLVYVFRGMSYETAPFDETLHIAVATMDG